MLKSVSFHSARELAELKRSPETVVISILSDAERSSRPRLNGYRGALVLDFDDEGENPPAVLAALGAASVPDELSPAEQEQLDRTLGVRMPSLRDARRIRDYLERHHKAETAVHLAVHCQAGVSRSAAVASWAVSEFNIELTGKRRSFTKANPRLLRLLSAA